MNKRIRELSEQANAWRPGGYPSGEGGDKAWKDVVIFEKDEDVQKFAELIVRECAKVIIDNEIDHPITGALYDGDQAKAIKKHFGVEE